MIHLDFANQFIEKTISNLFNQQDPNLISKKTDPSFLCIKIEIINNDLKLSYNNDFRNIRCPVQFNDIFKELYNLAVNHEYFIKKISYYPFRQSLKYQSHSHHLNYINNSILKNLCLYQKTGISKFDLYKKIWPSDKDYSINKLDTHLTNLKNFFMNNFEKKLDYLSDTGLLKLIN